MNILVLDDEKEIADLVEVYLKNEDYTVYKCYTAKDAIECIKTKVLDMAILDVMVQETSGFEICKMIREKGYCFPVMMLTAKIQDEDKITGLTLGADDYMTKPVNFEELVWRIDALLRRSKIAGEGRIVIGKTVVDNSNFTVTRGDEVLELPTKEFKLLFLLLSYPNKIFTKENILDKVWGYTCESDETTVRTHMNRLRAKFENFDEFELITIRGVGYKAVIKK